MAKGFKHGAGGSNPLNFKIVGNPKPANPKENTIWISTDVAIPQWRFQASSYNTELVGSVWIKTDTSSPASFNALKKNRIIVYPIAAYQHSDGQWVAKTAQIYKNGAWVDLGSNVITIYDSGNFNTNYATKLVAKAAKANSNTTATAEAPTINYNSTNCSVNVSAGWKHGIAYFDKKISLTNVNTIVLEVNGKTMDDAYGPSFYCWSSVPTYASEDAVAYKSCRTNGEQKQLTLDVSDLIGSYYIGFGLGSDYSEAGKVNMYKLTLQ